MKTKFRILTLALLSSLLFTNAYAGDSKSAMTNQGEAFIETEKETATVTKIDYKTRELTLKDDDGELIDIVADEEIKNFGQIKKGDVVTAEYTEALIYHINRGGKAVGIKETTQAQQARPGEKPMAGMAREVTATVVISEIDRKEPSVTFKSASGETRTVKVKHPEKLEGVKVGDSVDLTYAQAIALKVEKKQTL